MKKLYSAVLVSAAVIIFLILLPSAASAAPLKIVETQITTSGFSSDPTIYGDRIAYDVNSAINYDNTYVYDLSTKNVTVFDFDYSPISPDIYGNRLVFESSEGLTVYDFSTKETQYLIYSARSPKIYGDRVVFSDYERRIIHVYDLSTQKETQITNVSAWDTDIYMDKIVWADSRNGGTLDEYGYPDGNAGDIYMYDISTKKETRISKSVSARSCPSIYGDRIVWSDGRNGNWGDIYMYELSTKKETRITTNGSASNPCIYGDRIVWDYWRDSDPDKSNIYMYDISTKKETQITTNGFASNPCIYGDRIVWQDRRNRGDHSDIYMATVSSSNPLVSAFSASPLSGKAPLKAHFADKSTGSPTSWCWNFGDKTTSTAKNPVHKYSKAGKYTVSLTAKNAAGKNTVLKSSYIIVLNPLSAAFTASPTSRKAPLTVKFTDKSTGAPDSWSWNFGDKRTSTLQSPAHKYTKAGKYTVSLKVKNAAGSSTKTMSITVK